MASGESQPPSIPLEAQEAKSSNKNDSKKADKNGNNVLTFAIISAIVVVVVLIAIVVGYILIVKDGDEEVDITSDLFFLEVSRQGVYEKNTSVTYKGFIVDNTYFEIPGNGENIKLAGNWFEGFALPATASSEKKPNALSGAKPKLYEHGRAAVFLNIPYVKPPIGKLKFEMPQKMPGADYKKVVEQRNFKQFGQYCPQDGDWRAPLFKAANMTMSLDCLTLNVFTPANSTENSKLPVYALIHGGSLKDGSAADYGVRGLVEGFVSKGIVVVTMNYRLGAYGFLKFSGNEKGNSLRGLYDQIAALEWIQENIGIFGGDRKRVTIGGFSAGACSVAVLALAAFDSNNKIQHLFDRAIMQSGFLSLCSEESFIPGRSPVKFIQKLCVNESNIDKCVKSKETNKIIELQKVIFPLGMEFDFPDGIFNTINDMKSKAKSTKKAIKFFIGVDLDEVAVFEKIIGNMGKISVPYSSEYVVKIASLISRKENVIAQTVLSKPLDVYFKNAHDNVTKYYASMEMLTDMYFGNSVLLDTTSFTRTMNQTVYLYKFEYRGELFVNDAQFTYPKVAPHGASCYYATQPEHKWMSLNWSNSEKLTKEVAVARNIQKEFSNFIRGEEPEKAFDPENPLAYLSLRNSTIFRPEGFMKKSLYDQLKQF